MYASMYAHMTSLERKVTVAAPRVAPGQDSSQDSSACFSAFITSGHGRHTDSVNSGTQRRC